jgi:hypothetical protein
MIAFLAPHRRAGSSWWSFLTRRPGDSPLVRNMIERGRRTTRAIVVTEKLPRFYFNDEED